VRNLQSLIGAAGATLNFFASGKFPVCLPPGFNKKIYGSIKWR